MPTDPSPTRSHAPLRMLSQPEAMRLKAEFDRDKQFIAKVRSSAEFCRTTRAYGAVVADITGLPSALATFNNWEREYRRTLEDIESDLFFARITTRIQDRHGDESMTLLVSRSNGGGGSVYGDDWNLISWTDPISVLLLDASVGSKIPFRPAKPGPGGMAQSPLYTTEARARFGALEPRIVNSEYENRDGRFFITSEDELLEPVIALPPERPHVGYKSATIIGLDDIIEEADRTQRLAMHLPFTDNLLIDGPPGSGKTSIGIMRIPCLLAQQWQARARLPDRDPPFHTHDSMRVLVYGDEMKEYLVSLVSSLRVRVVVESTQAFLAKLARSAKTLSGPIVKDKRALTTVKSQPEMLMAYWRGFQRNVDKQLRQWQARLAVATQPFDAVEPKLGTAISSWAEAVERTKLASPDIPSTVNLAERLSRWLAAVKADLPDFDRVPAMPGPYMSREVAERAVTFRAQVIAKNERTKSTRDAFDAAVRAVRKTLSDFVHDCVDRAAIWTEMFDTETFASVPEAAIRHGLRPDDARAAVEEWRRQGLKSKPPAGDADIAACAWLGSGVLLIQDQEAPLVVGDRRPRLTHIVVDEVQDLPPCYIPIIASALAYEGTLTLVGDLHQTLNIAGGVSSWDRISGYVTERRTFGINYRQSRELGAFLRDLYTELFGDTPLWDPADTFSGPQAVLEVVPDRGGIVEAVARQVRKIREEMPEATVGILYDGKHDPTALRKFAKRVQDALSDGGIIVHFSPPNSGGARLRETDCAIVASVAETKGLEFDGVVFVDASGAYSGPLADISLRRRNGLYVAASRARHGLAFVMTSAPQFLLRVGERDHIVITDAGGSAADSADGDADALDDE